MHFDTAELAIKQQSTFDGNDSSNSLNLLDIVSTRIESPSQAAGADAPQQSKYPYLESWRTQEPATPPKPANNDISRAVEALPAHPMKDVMRELTNGVLSGKINPTQLAREMKELAAAVERNDASGLPSLEATDLIFAGSTLEKQLFKAIEPLNKMLRERGLRIEFWSDAKTVVISSGYDAYPPTNIAVRHNGEIKSFQGRHPGFHANEYKEIPLDQAVTALNRHASEYKPRRK